MVILEITLKIKNCLKKKNISMISKWLRLTKALLTGIILLMDQVAVAFFVK